MTPVVAAIDWNLALNVMALCVLVFAAVRLGTLKRMRDAVADYRAAVEAKDARIDSLEDRVKEAERLAGEAQTAAHEAQTTAARWEARYEELAQYAAKPAIEHFEAMFRDHRDTVGQRHNHMIKALEGLAEAQRAHGELMIALLARLDGQGDKK